MTTLTQKYETLGILWDSFISSLYSPVIPRNQTLCKFLLSKAESRHCTQYLKKHGYASHQVRCKDWDIANIIADLSDGNLLDMGSSDSHILRNAVLKGVQGKKYGIDLRESIVPVSGVEYMVGNLLHTPLPDAHLQNIACLSVIEHAVDFQEFAREVSRLLIVGGKLYLTFDYWNPKVTSSMLMYDRIWNVLDKEDVLRLITALQNKDLHLVQTVDWSLEKPVITVNYYGPDPQVRYTFGLLIFRKKQNLR